MCPGGIEVIRLGGRFHFRVSFSPVIYVSYRLYLFISLIPKTTRVTCVSLQPGHVCRPVRRKQPDANSKQIIPCNVPCDHLT